MLDDSQFLDLRKRTGCIREVNLDRTLIQRFIRSPFVVMWAPKTPKSRHAGSDVSDSEDSRRRVSPHLRSRSALDLRERPGSERLRDFRQLACLSGGGVSGTSKAKDKKSLRRNSTFTDFFPDIPEVARQKSLFKKKRLSSMIRPLRSIFSSPSEDAKSKKASRNEDENTKLQQNFFEGGYSTSQSRKWDSLINDDAPVPTKGSEAESESSEDSSDDSEAFSESEDEVAKGSPPRIPEDDAPGTVPQDRGRGRQRISSDENSDVPNVTITRSILDFDQPGMGQSVQEQAQGDFVEGTRSSTLSSPIVSSDPVRVSTGAMQMVSSWLTNNDLDAVPPEDPARATSSIQPMIAAADAVSGAAAAGEAANVAEIISASRDPSCANTATQTAIEAANAENPLLETLALVAVAALSAVCVHYLPQYIPRDINFNFF